MKKLKSALAGLVLATTIATGAELQKGLNAVEADIDNQQRAYVNIGLKTEQADAMLHSTNLITDRSLFSNHRVSLGISDYKVRPMMQVKTNYDGFTDTRAGLRVNKFPLADFGWIEFATNGENVELAGLAGKSFDAPVVGKLTAEMLNQVKYDGKDISHYGELQIMKPLGNFSPFVRVTAQNLQDPTYTIGIRYRF